MFAPSEGDVMRALRRPLQGLRRALPESGRVVLRGARRGQRLATSPLRPLPDWLIIGAQKSGTTFLYHTLVRQPGIRPALTKEAHYFDHHPDRTLMWYRSNFPVRLPGDAADRVSGRRILTGEATPYYMCHPLVPERVARVLPEVKLIAVLRNPVERAYSHFQHERAKGRETLSFREAIEREGDRLRGQEDRMVEDPSYNAYNHQRFSYLLRGLYAQYLELWLKHFPRSALLVIGAEDMYENPAATVEEAATFLGFQSSPPDSGAKLNARRYATMDGEARAFLVDYFKPHNERLFELLGRDFGWERGPALQRNGSR
jgi:hypothetical protein